MVYVVWYIFCITVLFYTQLNPFTRTVLQDDPSFLEKAMDPIMWVTHSTSSITHSTMFPFLFLFSRNVHIIPNSRMISTSSYKLSSKSE